MAKLLVMRATVRIFYNVQRKDVYTAIKGVFFFVQRKDVYAAIKKGFFFFCTRKIDAEKFPSMRGEGIIVPHWLLQFLASIFSRCPTQ